MSTALKLLAQIERFLADNDMSATTFGELAVSDVHQVHRLRKGQGLSTHRYDKMVAFMETFDSSNVVKKPAPWKRKKASDKPAKPRRKHKAEASAP